MRRTAVPDYKNIMDGRPKKVISDIDSPHGVCVADNGIFAVVSYKSIGNFRMYYGSGELLKVVRLPSGYGKLIHCTFAGDNLYVTDAKKKIYKYSINGTFIKVMASGEQYQYMTSCGNDKLYVTADKSLIAYHNEEEAWRVKVPTKLAREPVIGLNRNIHLSTSTNKVLFYNLKGKSIGIKELQGLKTGDGMVIDAAGNTLIVARAGLQKLLVYNPCGKLIRIIQFHTPVDVDVGNDGTIIVTDIEKNKVFMY